MPPNNLCPSLRYGNIVKSKSGVYLVVTEIMASGITYDRLDGKGVVGHAEWGEVKAISLTHEILKKCRFEERKQDEDYEYWGILNFTLIYGRTIDNDYRWFLNGYHNDCHIKYLHQLQNLFFDLTNTELKLTL